MEGTEIKMTDLKFKPVEAEDMKVLAPYLVCARTRPVTACRWTALSGGNIIMCGMPFMKIRRFYG